MPTAKDKDIPPPTDLADAKRMAEGETIEFDAPELGEPEPKKPTKRPAKKRAPRRSQPPLVERIADMYAGIGIILLPMSPNDARLFVTISEEALAAAALGQEGPDPFQPSAYSLRCARALDGWADQSPRVRKVLEQMLTGGAVAEVAVAHAPIIVGLLANHGINPLAFLLKSSEGESPIDQAGAASIPNNGSGGDSTEKTPGGARGFPVTGLGDSAPHPAA